nr:MAG TPA: hypothetical protein [Bacteriophage sp.]
MTLFLCADFLFICSIYIRFIRINFFYESTWKIFF